MNRTLTVAALCLVLALLVACGKTQQPLSQAPPEQPTVYTAPAPAAPQAAAMQPASADAAAKALDSSVTDVNSASQDLDATQLDAMDKDLAQVDNLDLG